jgi:hypothetical protein
VCGRGPLVHVCGQNGEDFKSRLCIACVEPDVCTRNWVTIQNSLTYLCWLAAAATETGDFACVCRCVGEGLWHTFTGRVDVISRANSALVINPPGMTISISSFSRLDVWCFIPHFHNFCASSQIEQIQKHMQVLMALTYAARKTS